MATLLADLARGLLSPLAVVSPPVPLPSEGPRTDNDALLARQIETRIQATVNDVLEYHRTHRPANTTKNYLPKQREWQVSCYPALGVAFGC